MEVKDYLDKPYTQIVKKVVDEVDGTFYVGRYLELPEARTHAESYEELEKRMKEVLELTIECRLKNNEDIPEPLAEDDFSGRFTLRIPKSLHRDLTVEAKNENVSLNQLALYKLAK